MFGVQKFSSPSRPLPRLAHTTTFHAASRITATAAVSPPANDANPSPTNATTAANVFISPSPDWLSTTTPSSKTVVPSDEKGSNDKFLHIDRIVEPEDGEPEEKEAELKLNDNEGVLTARKKIDQDKMRAAVAAASKNYEAGQIVTVKIPKQALLPGEP